MPTLAPVYKLAAPGFAQASRRLVTCRVTRNGEQTPSPKYVRLYRSATDTLPLAVIVLWNGYESSQVFSAADFDGAWYVQVIDLEEPRTGQIRWPTITQDVVLRFDLSDDAGGGGGDSAQLPAVVKVGDVLAERPVVVVEQLVDGTWKLAGFGGSSVTGEQLIDLKVTPSSLVYALSVEVWGVPFQPGLQVAIGTTIRPTLFQGWQYRITQAGNLPAVEPDWWDESLSGPQPLGTARAEVVRYYRPQGLGPLPVEMV